MAAPIALEDCSWREDATDLIERWAAEGRRFTADDLREAMRPAPTPNMIGSVFLAASRRRLIEKVADNQSRTKSRNGGHQYTWVGIPERHLQLVA
ncbi:hypothetical protein ACFY5D_03480 [Paeniglutamicibacter sp. NPDC012692]|uniref:hypothetical protein n=1 Tax=Paeniglutamicibacter sp. NPDC012692 TaxID=3364388 RepID=UPI0036795D5D